VEATEGMKNLYSVIQPFTAKTAISGRERKFLPGEDFMCDPAKPGETITIESDEFFFFVERSVFKTCCKFKGGAVVG
jgi:hypothetical protein